MALEFSDIYRRELEEIRQRRLHQWYSEQSTTDLPASAEEREAALPPDKMARITEDVPEDARPADEEVGPPLVFNKILEHLQATAVPAQGGPSPSGQPEAEPFHHGLIGLALSGGGVRSATFSLGAIQALDRWGVFKKVDYISTVSGGGFTGACLSSLYAKGNPEFPFRHTPGVPENALLRHLRNYSNYLAPRGFMDYLKVPGLLLRGILANLVIILPYVIAAAIATVYLFGPAIRTAVYANLALESEVVVAAVGPPAEMTFSDRQHDRLSLSLADLLDSWSFSAPVVISGLPPGAEVTSPGARKLADGTWRLSRSAIIAFDAAFPESAATRFTISVRMVNAASRAPDAPRVNIWDEFIFVAYWLIGTFVVLLLAYPLIQTIGSRFGLSTWHRRNRGNLYLAVLIGTIAIVVAVEVQPIAVYYFTLLWLAGKVPLIDTFTGVLTVVAGLLATLSGRIANKVNKLLGTLLLTGIGLLGPLVLWLIYIMLTRWAICGPPQWTEPPQWAGWLAQAAAAWPSPGGLCIQPSLGDALGEGSQTVVIAYGISAVVIFLYGLIFINVNRTSLHGYYRDRLSKAYLFNRPRRLDSAPDSAEELTQNDRQLLHELRGRPVAFGLLRRLVGIGKMVRQNWLNIFKAPTWSDLTDFFRRHADQPTTGRYVAPYHLINAAINIQKPGIHTVEKGQDTEEVMVRSHDLRGRKADYFLFSQLFVGSRITGYCRSEEMHEADWHLDLGTAMAISGAAAAPNMGTSTVKPLVFIMTMLNVRLGYWLPNPRLVHFRHHPNASRNSGATARPGRMQKLRMTLKRWLYVLRLAQRVGPLYLLLEMFGFLNESWAFVNVSDGGHIENLGLYPLLIRRCRLIIAVDGERDPKQDGRHKFSALATAIRHARIDEGIDIDIDLSQIGRTGGKHFAVGEIDYGPKFPPGCLVYIKSSLTQDENPYIREYHLKNPDFPHESTGDQFFDETQFECYRALGYHAAQDFLK